MPPAFQQMPNESSSEPPSSATSAGVKPAGKVVSLYDKTSLMQMAIKWIRQKVAGKPESSLKEVLEEVLEDKSEDALVISAEEKNLLKNMIHFGELTVRDIMVPRTDIMGIERDISLTELRDHVIKIGHTRIPVYVDSLDKIEGFVHVKDLFPHLASGEAFDIGKIIRKILFVPPSMRIVDLLLKMRVSGCHMAIVVDEYGGSDGLVTMEDLFEELVGEIQDEHDHEEQQELMLWLGDHVLEADARVAIALLEETLGERLTSGEISELEFDTLGGFIFFTLGRVPTKGEVVHVTSHIKIEILAADPRRIHRVRISRLAA